jgi:hypothetical protein
MSEPAGAAGSPVAAQVIPQLTGQVTSPTPASLMALVKVLNSPSLEGCEGDPLEQVVG